MTQKKKKKKRSTGHKRSLAGLFIVLLCILAAEVYRQQLHADTESRPEPADYEAYHIPTSQLARGGQRMYKPGFVLEYDADYKTPQWVGWALTPHMLEGTTERRRNFEADSEIRGAKAYPSDYTHSGYDRGHMAPAGDMKWSRESMHATFLLSNICPQNPALNRDDWNELEKQCRVWARRYGKIHITCGPVYYGQTPRRIGRNGIAVPDAFFKVVLINRPANPLAMAFLFPNKAGRKPLITYVVPVDSVERLTQLDFFPTLPAEVQARIERQAIRHLP